MEPTKELLLAVLEGDEAKVTALLDGGLSVNITGNQDNAPLHIAAMSGAGCRTAHDTCPHRQDPAMSKMDCIAQL